MKKKAFYGILDRIEGNVAVILVGEDEGTVEIPKTLLPDGSREGDMLSVKLEIKDKKTRSEKERVERLIKKLSS